MLTSAASSFAQPQDVIRQKCITKLNKGLGDVARAVRRDAAKCLKDAQLGKLRDGQTAEECLTADNKSKISKAQGKVLAADEKFCVKLPDFAYAGGLSINAAAIVGEFAMVTDLFGESLDEAAISKLADDLGKHCSGVNQVDAFPGICSNAADLAACLDELVSCRFCLSVNVGDDLNEYCDVLDNGGTGGNGSTGQAATLVVDGGSAPNVTP
ncbi:MAG: hypothetical protein ACI8TX_000872 [Hyphomicrobiaceae bacterium]